MACNEKESEYADLISTKLKQHAPNDKQIGISEGFKDAIGSLVI